MAKRISLSDYKEKINLISSSKAGEYFKKELQFLDYEVFKIALVGVYIEEWFKTSVEPSLRPNTVDGYKVNIEKHIRPNIGDKVLQELTATQIQNF